MITAKTLITNKSKAREISWANPRIWLEPEETRLVDGLYPSQCLKDSDRANCLEELESGVIDISLVTDLAVTDPKTMSARPGNVVNHMAAADTPDDVRPRTDVETRRQRLVAERALREREFQQRVALEKAGQELSAMKPSGKADEKIEIKVDDPFRRGRIANILPPATILGMDKDEAPPALPPMTPLFADDREAAEIREKLDAPILIPESVINAEPGAQSLPDQANMTALPPMTKQASALVDKHRLTAADIARMKTSGRDGKLLGTDVEEYLLETSRKG